MRCSSAAGGHMGIAECLPSPRFAPCCLAPPPSAACTSTAAASLPPSCFGPSRGHPQRFALRAHGHGHGPGVAWRGGSGAAPLLSHAHAAPRPRLLPLRAALSSGSSSSSHSSSSSGGVGPSTGGTSSSSSAAATAAPSPLSNINSSGGSSNTASSSGISGTTNMSNGISGGSGGSSGSNGSGNGASSSLVYPPLSTNGVGGGIGSVGGGVSGHVSSMDSLFGREEEEEPPTLPLDVDKETARRERRMVFTFRDWKRHRSSARFLHHLSTIPESGVIRGVLLHVCVFCILATGVASYNHFFEIGCLPAGLPAPPRIAIEPIQLTSFALSLLLVFRTNASYSRFQEARRRFGSITTTARDIARQGFAWFHDLDAKQSLTRWLIALSKSSMAHLRDGEHELRSMLSGVLQPQEMQWLEASQHRPNFCVQMLTRIIARAGLPTELVLRMDENLSELVSAISSCERIINTPIPMSYTRHTARFLMVWLSCLPFSLWSYCGWAMVPIAAIISFVLLGIEEIGVYIEEPFSLLPLENLCDKLSRILSSMMQEHMEISQNLGPTNFYTPVNSAGLQYTRQSPGAAQEAAAA